LVEIIIKVLLKLAADIHIFYYNVY